MSRARSYQSEHRVALTVVTPMETLEKWLKNNRGEMRSKAIESFRKEILTVAAKWKVQL
jgi:hypothetical protein